MLFRFLLFTQLVLFSEFSHGQEEEVVSDNIVYIEALGAGGLGSLNYERITFRKSGFQIGIRLGVAVNKFKDFKNKFNPDFAFPITANFAYGSAFKGEINIGTTYTNTVSADNTLQIQRSTAMHGIVAAGFRYQPKHSGLFFRTGYSPILEKFTRLRHWGYLSIGIVF